MEHTFLLFLRLQQLLHQVHHMFQQKLTRQQLVTQEEQVHIHIEQLQVEHQAPDIQQLTTQNGMLTLLHIILELHK